MPNVSNVETSEKEKHLSNNGLFYWAQSSITNARWQCVKIFCILHGFCILHLIHFHYTKAGVRMHLEKHDEQHLKLPYIE